MFATISNKEYTYSIWNNEKLDDSLIAMDTETTVRERPEIPQLVLTTASDGKLHVIIPNDKLDAFLNMHKNARFVFYNISFDFWVIKQFLPNNRVLYTAADNNKLHDYMLLDMLYRLALNDNFPVMRNLGEASKYYANMTIDKEDPYRVRYEEILNKDLMSVPIGFLEYAIKDTIVTWIGFRQLFSKAKQLAYSYGISSEILNSFGLFTESLQVKAAISLTKITNNGICLDTTLSNEMHREIEKVIWETVQKLDSEYPEDEARDIPALFKKCKKGEFILTENGTPKISRKRLGIIFEDVAKQLNAIKEIKLVAPMTKTKKISTSMPLWSDYTAHNDFLTKWKIWSDNTKAAQFFCKLNRKNIYPRYKFFVRTGRTSQQDPNCQQIKKGRMREIIIPRKGFALVAADYSFIELRTLAHIMEKLFKKSVMAEVIRTGKDPHSFTGGMLVNLDYDEFYALKKTRPEYYDKWRQNAKACFHEDVEVLTPKGWKKISDILEKDLVAQYTKEGKVEFVHPTGTIKIENKKLYELKSRHFSLRVTDDHNMYCLDWAEKPCTCKPKDFARKARKTVHAGYMEGAISDEIAIRQAVAIQADGSIAYSQYCFGFKKERKIERFKELFENVFFKEVYDEKYGTTRFHIPNDLPYSKYLNSDKTFNTEEILKLDLTSRIAFIDELFYWDGSHKTERAFSFTSVNLDVINTVQAVAATCGYRTVFNEWIPNLSTNPAYSLGITKIETARPSKMTHTLVEENTTVYCISVPSTLLIVKDKGSVQVCHNCNFGIPGGLSAPSLLNYAKNIYHIKDWTIETAKNFRDKICNEIYPELGKYLQEDSMRIMCESLGCNTEDAWELFEMQGERSPFILNCVKNIVKGEPFKKDGSRYQEGFITKVWDNLLKLNNNSTLHSLLKEHTANLDLMKKLFWTSTVTLTGRVRGKVSFTQNKNCLDAETEALTKRGWIKGFDLTLEDEILTKNIDTGYLEWQKPTDLKFYPDYEGPLVEFKTKNFSAISTPDHRWMVYNKATGKNECRITDKISVYGDTRIHRTGNYIAPTEEIFNDDFVEIVGWYLTDGSGKSTERKTVENYIQVQIFQSERANLEKVKKIEKALTSLDMISSTHLDIDTELRRFHLKREHAEKIFNMFPNRILNTEFLLKLTKSQLNILLNTMIDGDGCRSGGKIRFHTKSKESADLFQMLCTLNNLSSTCNYRDMSKYQPKSKKLKNVPKMKHIYIVNVLKRDKVQIQKKHKKTYISKEPIWCPIVPNTYFVARREAQVFITGNTPFQGLAADGAKLAAYRLIKEEEQVGYSLVNFVHDEFLFEFPDLGGYVDKSKVDYVLKVMCEEMEKLTPGVPIAGEYTVAKSWTKKNPNMRIEDNKIYF